MNTATPAFLTETAWLADNIHQQGLKVIDCHCFLDVLAMLGYGNVAVYDGSMEEWAKDARLPMETV